MKHPFKKLTTVVSAFLATFLFISTISFTSPFIGANADAVESNGDNIVYFLNESNWGDPRCHYWGGTSPTSWPGEQMTDTGYSFLGNKIYSCNLGDNTGLIFSNNGNDQTGDLTYNSSTTLFSKNNSDWYSYSGNGFECYLQGADGTWSASATNKMSIPDATNKKYEYYWSGSVTADPYGNRMAKVWMVSDINGVNKLEAWFSIDEGTQEKPVSGMYPEGCVEWNVGDNQNLSFKHDDHYEVYFDSSIFNSSNNNYYAKYYCVNHNYSYSLNGGERTYFRYNGLGDYPLEGQKEEFGAYGLNVSRLDRIQIFNGTTELPYSETFEPQDGTNNIFLSQGKFLFASTGSTDVYFKTFNTPNFYKIYGSNYTGVGGQFYLVNDINELKSGDTYIIGTTNNGDGKFMSNVVGGNYVPSIDGNVQDGIVTATSDFLHLRLKYEIVSGLWQFETFNYLDTNGYLARSNTLSDNHLLVSSTPAVDSDIFSISINDDSSADIVNTLRDNTKQIQYNAVSRYQYFGTYANTQSKVYLYRQAFSTDGPTSISLNSSSLELDLNDGTYSDLVVSYEPSNCLHKGVTWASSDPSVATVDSDTGVITLLSKGNTTITATSTYNSELTASCNVTVTQAVEISAEIEETKVDLFYRGINGQPISYELTCHHSPEEAAETFTTSDANVATVDSNGVVTRVGIGTCVITYTVSYNGASVSDTCNVEVKEDRKPFFKEVTSISENKTYVIGDKNKNYFITAYNTNQFSIVSHPGFSTLMTFEMELISGDGYTLKKDNTYYYVRSGENVILNTTNQGTAAQYSWFLNAESKNEYALSINDKILKSTSDHNSARAYAKSNDGDNFYLYEMYETTVNVQITNKSFDSEDFEYTSTTNTDQLIATSTKLFNPPEARSLIWSSSNTNIATVNESGLVSFTGENGAVTITVCDSEETWVSATHTYKVTNVDAHIISVAIDTPSTTEIDVNASSATHTLSLTAIVDKAGDIDDSVTWTTSDSSKATVVSTGDKTSLVTATGAGTVTITAISTADNTKFGSIELSVIDSTPILHSIKITRMPNKVDGYNVGENIVLTGMEIEVTYTNADPQTYSYSDVQDRISYSPTKIGHPGTNIVEITYSENGKSASADLRVYANDYIPENKQDYEDRNSYRDLSDYGYYEKVLYSSDARDYTGRYLIVYEFENTDHTHSLYVFDASKSKTDITAAPNYYLIPNGQYVLSEDTNFIYTSINDFFNYEFEFQGVKTKDNTYYYKIQGNGINEKYLIGYRDISKVGIDSYVLSSTSDGIRNNIVINPDNTLSIYCYSGFQLKFYNADSDADKIFRFTGASGGANKSVYLYKWHSYYSDAKEYADGFKNYFVECYSDEEQTNLINYTKLVEKFKDANADFKLLNAGAQGYLKPIEESHTYVFEPAVGDDSKINQVKNRCAECMMSRYGLSLGMNDDDFETLKNSPLYKHYDFKIDDDSSVLLIIISSSSILLATSAALLFVLKKKKKQISK